VDARSLASRIDDPPPVRTTKAAVAVLAMCIAFFAWDIFADVREAGGSAALRPTEILHLSVEVLSLAGLAFVIAVLHAYIRHLRSRAEELRHTVALLRGDLGGVLARRFEDWRLTAAERDVAVMILKGAGVAEIAAARGTAPGTVKAQTTAVFRKIGVGSRAELMSVFLDEFLEAGPPGAARQAEAAAAP
jgi:DNA-binding CsgD family transcriptional regulator